MRHRARATVVNGTRYRSGFEAAVARALLDRGVEFGYERVKLFYERPCVYILDFNIGDLMIEVKGYFSPADRRKMLEVQRSNPGIDLRIVFQNASNKLSRAPRSSTYGQWATRNGFKWAEGEVPEAWLLEIGD
jgi:hypothetical protein